MPVSMPAIVLTKCILLCIQLDFRMGIVIRPTNSKSRIIRLLLHAIWCCDFCDHTTITIRINITEPNHRSDGRLYWYMWSPCEAYSCPGYLAKTDCALCQKADAHWCCGQTANPIFKWDTYSRIPGMYQESADRPRPSFPGYSIEYTFGSAWRYVIKLPFPIFTVVQIHLLIH